MGSRVAGGLNLKFYHKGKLNSHLKKRSCGCGSHCIQSAQDDAHDKDTRETCGGVLLLAEEEVPKPSHDGVGDGPFESLPLQRLSHLPVLILHALHG